MLRSARRGVPIGAALLACAVFLSSQSCAAKPALPTARKGGLSDRLIGITPESVWTQVAAVPLRFRTFHPQGVVKIGDDFYLSSVEVLRWPRPADARKGLSGDAGAGVGHLFRFGADGVLHADLRLGEGDAYHPGGIDFDGRRIWVPVSEYRPDSRAVIYTVDPTTMTSKVAFRFDDHVGAVAMDRARRELHGFSWGGRRRYRWRVDAAHAAATARSRATTPPSVNPFHYIEYQDCHGVGEGRMLCGGLADRPTGDGGTSQVGGLELIAMGDGRPLWQLPFPIRSAKGRLMTQNPVFVELTEKGVRAYFIPDDDDSTLYVYELPPASPKP